MIHNTLSFFTQISLLVTDKKRVGQFTQIRLSVWNIVENCYKFTIVPVTKATNPCDDIQEMPYYVAKSCIIFSQSLICTTDKVSANK